MTILNENHWVACPHFVEAWNLVQSSSSLIKGLSDAAGDDRPSYYIRRLQADMTISIAIIILVLQTCSGSRPNLYNIKSSLFYWADLGLADTISTESRPVAFADVNNDKKVDLIVLSPDQKQIDIHLWSSDQWQFNIMKSMSIKVSDFVITGVVPGDFNYDGKIDLFVQGKISPNSNDYVCRMFLMDPTKSTFEPKQSFTSAEELLVFDYNADMHLDLFGFSTPNERRVWVNDKTGNFVMQEFAGMGDHQHNVNTKGRPHSYADLNGDCIADLIVATDSELEIYVWDLPNSKWTFAQSITPEKNFGPVALADANGDGHIDIIYATVNSDVSSVFIHYNIQKPLCSSSSQTGCRSSDNLCSVDPDFKFHSFSGSNDKNVVGTILSVHLEENSMIRVGDINADGLPELLMTTSDQMLVMISCLPNGGVAPVSDPRITSVLKSYSGAVGGAFFDINEDGLQDVLLIDRSAVPMKFLLNNLNEDTFFFKTLVSNGVCPEWCPETIWPEKFPNPKPYGVNQPGVTVRFTVSDTNGARRIVSGAQLSQSSYRSLQTPYVFAGLARTFSYIEQFSVGVSSGFVGTWTSMIPNSQLVVFPYPPNSPDKWVVELFLSPTNNWIWVAVSVIVTSVALLAAIVMLHWRHLKADLLQQRKAERFFTF